MRLTLRMMGLASIVAVAAIAIVPTLTHAGCGGGSRGSGGHSVGRTSCGGYNGGGSCCGMGNMAMGGMGTGATPMSNGNMEGMSMGGGSASGRNGGAAPTAATQPTTAASAKYYCPMHPNVMSTFPATCPYCQMALVKKR
jgi:Heavy metal binding domain